MKEVTINFHTKTLGIFDVVQPVFEEDDIVFNSSMLKEFIEQMISAGKRNFAIDMSPLDDFSSGDNNALRELNKKVLGLNGTFTLFSPQPRVVGILQRMDIPSIIGVFKTEDELLALSEEIKRHQTPQSEFESLRSEIGSAFGETPLQTAAPAAAPAASPAPAEPPQSFDSFEIEPAAPTAAPSPPPAPPKAPAFGPPPPRTDAPIAPLPASHDFPESDLSSPETQRFPEAPVRSAVKAAPAEKEDDSFDFDDDEFEKPKKGLPVLAIAAVLALIVIGVGGFLLFGMKKGGDEAAPVAAASTPKPAEPVAEEKAEETAPVKEEIPVATVEIPSAEPVSVPAPAAKAPAPTPAAKIASTPPARAPVAKAAPAAKTAPPPVAKAAPAPAAKTAPPPAKAPVAAKTEPAPAPTPAPAPPPAQKNQIVITSNPSGAEIEIDGERKGVTPYTWNTPFFGDMVITVSKAGFAKASKNVDYSGGSQTHAFTLQAAQAAPPPAPAPTPAPAPAAAAPPPPPAASGASIFIATLPSHADVYIGGRLIGKSNDAELQVPTGTHQVRFVKDGLEKTESMTFQAGKNPTRFVNLR